MGQVTVAFTAIELFGNLFFQPGSELLLPSYAVPQPLRCSKGCLSRCCVARPRGRSAPQAKQAHQRADDGDHDKQFDKREAAATGRDVKACHGGVLCGQEQRE